MKVLTITEGYPPVPGGGSTYAYEIPQRLSKYGIETLVVTSKSDKKHKDDSNDKVSVLRVDVPEYEKAGFSFNLKRFRFVIECIKKGIELKDEYDVYHFHSGMASKVTSWALRNIYGMKKPFMMTFLGTFVGYYDKIYSFPISNVLEFFSKRLMIGSKCDRYIVVDDGTHAEKFLIEEGVPRRKIRKHYQTVDLKKFKPDRNRKKNKTVGYIGRMDPMKGVDIFLKSLPDVIEKHEDLRVILIGDGPLKSDMEKLTRKLGIHSKVKFVGNVDHSDMPKYMNMLDCVVFTDIRSFDNRDLISLTHCEAMASGCLILNSARPRKEWGYETWVQIDNPNPSEISSKLNMILNDPEKFKVFRKNARKVAEKFFRWDNVIEMYKEELQNIVSD